MKFRMPKIVYVDGRPILLHASMVVTHEVEQHAHSFDVLRDHLMRALSDDMCHHVVKRYVRTYPAPDIPDASEFHVAVYVIDPYEVEAGVRALLDAYPEVLAAIRSE